MAIQIGGVLVASQSSTRMSGSLIRTEVRHEHLARVLETRRALRLIPIGEIINEAVQPAL